ncbi:glyoxalase/Bleomycin resistance protein/Dioxygenase [Diaporthe helianthi]|uniref:Glyoxalase/Bleomycin resistance protein/Dioxygenase n=1 Tax=Diaporthe helianthi TaxID=158607 RepID=A0A2P5HF09_DIAHE|nr:glyoxalase/Bleomycin resistance protein/Dioxygenase [Diaporthe helianthi]
MTTNSNPGKVLSPAALVHVVLQTSQFEPMVAFYKAFLGAHATYENEFLAFLTYDEEHHRVAIAHVPSAKPRDPTAAGMAHMAFSFNTLNDLLQAYRQRKARGILPIWAINHGPTTSMYYQDPDGNQIETQVDNFESVEDATAFMNTPEFAENPIGVDFDPEDLIRRVESGEDDASLRKRPRIGPRGIEGVPVPPKPDVRKSYDIIQTRGT